MELFWQLKPISARSHPPQTASSDDAAQSPRRIVYDNECWAFENGQGKEEMV